VTVRARLSHAARVDLDGYRAEYVTERIRRAVEREGVADEAGLARLVAVDDGARARFRRSLAVSVSGLFRDPAQFEHLEREVLPAMVADGRRIGVWSAGCADGSELTSIALIIRRLGALERTFFLGSDLLAENIERARAGDYGDDEIPADVRYRLRWEQRDLLRDGAPEGRWRLILCRNLAIYLAPSARDALHHTLAGALATGGVLLLGRAERLSRPEPLGLEQIGLQAYRRAA
jgi:chemotaxis protein methyltransferase CheR